MVDIKRLSLIHLERGLAIMEKVLNQEEGAATEMLAVYLSSAGTLAKAKKEPVALDAAREEAMEMPGEEAAKLISDFFAQCVGYLTSILGSLPEIPEAVKEQIRKAQGRPAPLSPESSPTS